MTQQPFIARVLEEPLLVNPDRAASFSANLNYLVTDPQGQALLAAAAEDQDEFWPEAGSPMARFRPYNVQAGVLQIPVFGALLNRFSFQFGGWATGYQYIEKAMARGLADANVRGIAFLYDTPGGEVAGNFELAGKMFSARGEKPMRAFVEDRALSAGYSLASAQSEVITTPSGRTGSIGVVTMHIDQSERLAMAGLKVTYIFAGKHKVDGNSTEPLPDDVKARIQGQIDKIYGVFTGLVARNRGVDEKDVRKTEALVYDADASVENNLADRIGNFEDELARFAEEVNAGEFRMTQKDNATASITLEAHEAALATARTEAAAEAVEAASTIASEAVAAERARFKAVTEHAAYPGREAQAHKMLGSTDLSAEQIGELLEAAPKAQAKGRGSESHFSKHMNGDEHPNVGPDGDEGDDAPDTPEARADKLLGSLALATGGDVRKSKSTQH